VKDGRWDWFVTVDVLVKLGDATEYVAVEESKSEVLEEVIVEDWVELVLLLPIRGFSSLDFCFNFFSNLFF
jgi:hypothetical protein